MTKRYETPPAMRAALLARHKDPAEQRLVAMERFVTRLAKHLAGNFIVKGGMSLQLKLSRPRTTKDLDLTVAGDPDHFLARLNEAASLVLGDFFEFEAAPDKRDVLDHPLLEYPGRRYKVRASVSGKSFATFSVDVAFGPIPPPEFCPTHYLGWAEAVEFANIPTLPDALQVAEKFHAYSVPTERRNTRHRDLPDLCMLAARGEFRAASLRQALERTFRERAKLGGHDLPTRVPPPLPTWKSARPDLHLDAGLEQFEELYRRLAAFLDPVLAGADGIWDPNELAWAPAPP